MPAAARHTTFIPAGSSVQPRLSLSSDRVSRAVLNGGWWPRSRDPAAELPGLLAAMTDHYGPIRRLILNSHAWDAGFDRLVVGSGTVQVRWFSTAEPSLLVAITEPGDQVNLLVVPPATSAVTARTAMAKAADPANRLHAPAILAALSNALTDRG
ncbi:DUF5994 family protein [Dactylosporangium sp. NPDC051485]|uniref:DUF5994 family protein n=1 Tax=Dactylosporangium sp. NPDC051485 TaxID=3154846 RepID=UPI0034130CE2